MEDRFQVGVITTTHGVRGEVKVFPTTDDVKRFKRLKKVILDTGKEEKILEVEGARFMKNLVLLKFKGYDSINDIEKYTKCDLLVSREDAVKLEPGEYFICDLIGLDVITDEGKHLGVLKDVLETGANNVYEVEADNGESYLIPVIDQCILDHDLDKKTITVHILPGLLDINK